MVHLTIWLLFIELGLRVWGFSLIGFAEGDGHDAAMRLLGLGGTLLAAWLVWILADTAVHHALVRSRRGLANARAQTMMPLIRNVMFVAIFIIAVIVACFLDVDAISRVLLIGSVLLVMIVEILNSAIEAVVDRIGSDFHELSGRAKDMGSAAVLLAIITAVITWVTLLWSHFR